MSDGTAIEWTDATWNVVNGCTVYSPGCERCYAMRLAATRMANHPSRSGLARIHKGHPQWTGEVRLNEPVLDQPLRWRRPRKIFVCAHGDLFHEKVPSLWIDQVFAVMAAAPQHIFQVLTKRADRMRQYADEAMGCGEHWLAHIERSHAPMWPLPNVWLGVSVEDQQRAHERIPELLATPAAVRWLSCEPLLGPVDLSAWMKPVHHHPDNRDRSSSAMQALIKAARDKLGGGIDWVIAGGESGPDSRPMHPEWARSLRDQCAAAGVPFLFKQWGDWSPIGRLHDDAGDTDETIAAETAMIEAMQDLPDGGLWIDPRRLQLVDRRMFNWANEEAQHPPHAIVIKRAGKKFAGRLLDGVQHDRYPHEATK